jgi:hypothetical protein
VVRRLPPESFSQQEWDDLAVRFAPGTPVCGVVVSCEVFGVFVELDDLPEVPALLELIHFQAVEEEPDRRLTFPEDYPKVGERVLARILAWCMEPKDVRLTPLSHLEWSQRRWLADRSASPGAAGDPARANVRLQALLKAQSMKEVISLTPDQLAKVHARAEGIDKDLRGRFEQASTAWRSTWSHPLIAVSSAPAARAQSTEFLELIALGPEVLPLLMEKLTDPEEFFALVPVDRLARPELQVSRELDDEAVLLGEQGCAIETVKRWVQLEL